MVLNFDLTPRSLRVKAMTCQLCGSVFKTKCMQLIRRRRVNMMIWGDGMTLLGILKYSVDDMMILGMINIKGLMWWSRVRMSHLKSIAVPTDWALSRLGPVLGGCLLPDHPTHWSLQPIPDITRILKDISDQTNLETLKNVWGKT